MLREIRGVERSLPPELTRFIEEKLTQHARPARRFTRLGLTVPRWLARLREREARQR